MEEQKPAEITGGMAAPSDAPSTLTEQVIRPAPMKLNRKMRRATMAQKVRAKKMAAAATRRRLVSFQELSAFKDSKAAQKLTAEQRDSIFRVGLSKIFKEDFKEGFTAKLNAIAKNVKNGFKYKADVIPTASPIAEPVTATPVAE